MMHVRRTSRGFTLVELLVVIAVLGLLVSLLLPAVQAARESSRRSSCQNNLHELGVAFQLHHDSRGGFPSSRYSPTRGFAVDVLPFMEEIGLFELYDMDLAFYEPENETVASTPISLLQCPSTPEPNRIIPLGTSNGVLYGTHGIAADYSANHMLNNMYQVNGARANPALSKNGTPNSTRVITDGTSCTTLLMEQAGRPDHYIMGNKQPNWSSQLYPNWWGVQSGYLTFQYQGYTADGQASGWDCSMNCNNAQGIYSFHPGGSMVLYCDGSVHFWNENMPVELVFALASRDSGEALSETDYE